MRAGARALTRACVHADVHVAGELWPVASNGRREVRGSGSGAEILIKRRALRSPRTLLPEARAKWVPARRNVERFQGLGQGR